MRRECQERFSRHQLQRKPLVSDPDMHYGTARALMHVEIDKKNNLRWRGKRPRYSQAHAQPAILRICKDNTVNTYPCWDQS